jgi:hypothetical protein
MKNLGIVLTQLITTGSFVVKCAVVGRVIAVIYKLVRLIINKAYTDALHNRVRHSDIRILKI